MLWYVQTPEPPAEAPWLEISDGTQVAGRAMPRLGPTSGGGSLLSVSLLATSHPQGTGYAASANHFVQHWPRD